MIVETLNQDWFESLVDEVQGNLAELYTRIENNYIPNNSIDAETDQKLKNRSELDFEFELEKDLRKIYKYIINERSKPEDINEILDNIKKIVWDNPFIPTIGIEVNWSKWEKTKLGMLINIAYAKLKYDNKEDMTPKEIASLLGVTPNAIRKQIKEGRLDAQKDKRGWKIKSKDYENIINF